MVKAKNTKGFTLIEMIITITVLIIVVGIIGGTLMVTFQNFAALNSRSAVHNEENQIRMALLSMVRDVRYSDRVFAAGQDELILRASEDDGTQFYIVYGIDTSSGSPELTRVFRSTPTGAEIPPPPEWPVGFARSAISQFYAHPEVFAYCNYNARVMPEPAPNYNDATHVAIEVITVFDSDTFTIMGYGAIQRLVPQS
jgi:type II secretory pathway pseudopilin PulG